MRNSDTQDCRGVNKEHGTDKEERYECQPTDGSGESERIITLQTDGRFFLAVFGIALTSGQAALQLLGHAVIAVLAHWPQVNFNKLISELPQMQQVKHVREEIGREGGKRAKEGRVVAGEVNTHRQSVETRCRGVTEN